MPLAAEWGDSLSTPAARIAENAWGYIHAFGDPHANILLPRMLRLRSPVDLSSLDYSSASALEAQVTGHKRSGSLEWIRAEAFSLDNEQWHSALCRVLSHFGLCGETSRVPPQVAVLDWSRTETCSAEGLAFFAVLIQRLTSIGVTVVACDAGLSDVSLVLETSGARAMTQTKRWISGKPEARNSVETLVPLAVSATGTTNGIGIFCNSLNDSLVALGATKKCRQAVVGTVIDLIQNVKSHSQAQYAAATALLLSRKRPKIIQIGIADDGLGIPNTVLSQPLHQWLAWFPDASLTEVVLDQGLSSRESQSGGGSAHLIRRLVSEVRSRVIIRTAGALISFDSEAPSKFTKRNLSPGLGTQVRLEVSL